MSDDNGGTITADVEIKELEGRLTEETDRLRILHTAYKEQQKEIVNFKAEIEVLSKEIVDREIEKESLESLLTEKDNRIRELELKSSKSTKQVEYLEPELAKMEEKFSREKTRLGKVFNIAEELDNDLRLAVSEMRARDDWYVGHMALFEDLNKAIKLRYDLIEQAVEAERKSQHMQRAIADRMDEMIEIRAAEMTIEEAETTASADVVEPETEETADDDGDENDSAESEAKKSDDEDADEDAEPSEESEEASNDDDEESEEASNDDDEESEEEETAPAKPAPAADWGDDLDPWSDS
ncbi:MAG: hypothetical protein HOB52_01640 [Euryarchaeota archaeon]|nr:hypothetical protein [Euryarchaeota archaeon]